jgi:hypothetical protein
MRSRLFPYLPVTALALAFRIGLAVFTYGTNDASMWESSTRLIRDGKAAQIYSHRVTVTDPKGEGLDEQIFNQPPFMITMLQLLNGVQDVTGLPVHVSMRVLDALADAGTILLTGAIMVHLISGVPFWPMILIALAPSWAFISGFHVNTDPLMVFLLVLGVYFIEVRKWSGWGGLSVAAASGIKIVPLLLLPALLLYLKTWSDRIRLAVIVGVFQVATALRWLIADDRGLARDVLGYRSIADHWGIGLILRNARGAALLSPAFDGLAGRYGLILLLVLITVAVNRRAPTIDLFRQTGVLLVAFIVFTPGFGIQYLAWLFPWMVVLPVGVVASYVAASTVFCAAVYTYWSGGIPWWYANSIATGTWRGYLALLGVATWVSVVVALEAYRRQIVASSTSDTSLRRVHTRGMD